MTAFHTTDGFDDELLSAYIDGELSVEERARVEAQLEADPAARRLLAELQGASAAMRALPREALPRELQAAMWRQIDASDADHDAAAAKLPRPATVDRWPGLWRGLAWGAAAVAASALLMAVLPPGLPRGEREVAVKAKREAPPAADQAALPAPPPAVAAADARSRAPLSSGKLADEAGAQATDLSLEGVAARGIGSGATAHAGAAQRTVEVQLAQPGGAAQFEQVLLANNIQFEFADGAADDPRLVEPGESAASRQMAASSPASEQRLQRENKLKEDSSTARQAGRDQVTAVIVEATPSQIDQVIFACRMDRLNFAQIAEPAPGRQLAEALGSDRGDAQSPLRDGASAAATTPQGYAGGAAGNRPATGVDLRKSAPGQQPNGPQPQQQQRGRALQINVPRALVADRDQTQLEAAVRSALAANRAASADQQAEPQVVVLFLLDPAGGENSR